MQAENVENIESIEGIEERLKEILQSDSEKWVESYSLMDRVQEQELYKPHYKSFTQWLNHLATVCKIQVSMLWKRKKAGEFFSKVKERASSEGIELPELTDIKVSPINLEFAEKIAGNDMKLATKLVSKIASGELKRGDLQKTWHATKSKGASSRKTRHDGETTHYDEQALTAGEIVSTISRYSKWLNDVYCEGGKRESRVYKTLTELAVRTGSTSHARRIDLVILEDITGKIPADTSLHGIEIKVSKGDLLNDQKMQEYVPFLDYFWIAIPSDSDLVEYAQEVALNEWGIITVADDRVNVIRVAKRQPRALQGLGWQEVAYRFAKK